MSRSCDELGTCQARTPLCHDCPLLTPQPLGAEELLLECSQPPHAEHVALVALLLSSLVTSGLMVLLCLVYINAGGWFR